ncbi:MAG TPA: ABC transporter permease [Candidatus Acidoferrum sp.]|nr:ABC transporter permease [Candidatus Acidoferrum sp.]
MRRFRAWFFGIAGIFREESRGRELTAEMESHLQLHIDDNLRAGMIAEEARRQALIRLGGIEQTKEAYRERRGLPVLETSLQDLRFAARMLRKNLGVTVIVVLTLALGVGANTAIFGLVNGLLLQRLPVPAAEQIAALVIQSGDSSLGALGFSYPQFVEFRKQTATICEVFGSATAWRLNFTAEGHSDTLTVGGVSSNYFSALGVRPALGRLILPGEGEHPGEPAILVLSYSFWQRRFGGDPQVIGKQARMGGKPATIVGVMEKEFRGQFSVFDMDAYAPLSTAFDKSSATNFWNSRDIHLMLVLGRLKPGVTFAQAQSRFDVISRRLAAQYPATDKDLSVRVMDERFSRPIPYANNAFIVFSGLFLILGALVLLLACTNIANILMARASVRQREMAIRAALGGARFRLVRQMLTETMLTALLGGVAGVTLGASLSHLASSTHLSNIPVRLGFGFDWRVFVYALAAVVFTAISAGLSPALRATRADVNTVLHQGGRADAGGKARHKVRGDLMAAQIAGSLMLLIVAGLFVRSLRAVEHMDIGFDPNQLLNVRLDPSIHNFSETQTKEFYRSLAATIRALPGVQSASLASAVPIGYMLARQSVYVEGRPVPPGQKAPEMMFNSVDAPYFETLRVRVLLGRAFTDADSETSPRVAIVNETMARLFWPGENPIGKRFSLTSDAGPFVEIVGVARDGKYRVLAEDPQPYFYVPLTQHFTAQRTLQIRSSMPYDSLAPLVQREIQALDANDPIEEIQTMKESLGGTLGYFIYRLGASLAAAMGLLGLLLAVVGVYGVVSYAATQRTQELGIRMALGASPRQILALLLKQGARLVIAGLLFGLAGTWVLTRAMTHMLVAVSPSDPLTYLSVAALLSFITLLACWIPARRAIRVDPTVALRYE